MKGVLFPKGPNRDIAIEINPFIVKWFINLISRWRVQLPSYTLERMCVSLPIAAIDVIISKEAGAKGGERS